MKLHWRCEWCRAGGWVELKHDPATATVQDAAPAMDALKAVSHQHAKASALCHVFRTVLWVRTSAKPIPKR